MALLILGLLLYLACALWINASNMFRKIMHAESLIYEYKKNREEYLLWKKDVCKKESPKRGNLQAVAEASERMKRDG